MKARPRYLPYKNVTAYIASYPKEIATRLRALRAIIRKEAPDAQEGISYGMPAYKLNGPMIYFSAFKNHIGLYALPETNAKFKKELAAYKTTKGTMQFRHDEPFPTTLIQKVVKYRAKESRNKGR